MMETENFFDAMISRGDYACWFDKIELLAKQEKQHLEAILPLDALERESKLFKIIHSSKRAKGWGYFSKIIVTLPSPSFLEGLYIEEISNLKVSYIEVALDIFCESELQAESECRNIMKHLRKKYCRTSVIYDASLKVPKKNAGLRTKKEELFGEVTGYFGSNKNMLALYARQSKFNDIPCIHMEFRIKGEQVKKKTGINSLSDLLSFQPEEYFMKEVDNVVMESIDDSKLGKWILDAIGFRFTNIKRKNMRISLAVTSFINTFGIKTNTDLINYFKNAKKEILKHRGARNRWQKKVLALRNHNRFFVSL